MYSNTNYQHYTTHSTEGTHDELLASALKGEGAGIYANLWNLQLQHKDRSSPEDPALADAEEEMKFQ